MQRTLLAFVLLCGPAFGQTPPPSPAKPAPVASVKVPDGPLYAGDLIVLDGSASVGDLIDWELISPPDVTTYVMDSNGKTVAFANKTPGTYVFRVAAESVIDGKIAKSKQRVVFTTIGSAPIPIPVPVPTPGPGPTPPPIVPPAPVIPTTQAPLDVVLVYDLNDIADVTAPVRISSIAADLAAMGASWFPLDARTATAAPFVARMKLDNIAVPSVYVTERSNGKVWAKVIAPTSKADVIAAIKAIRGSK